MIADSRVKEALAVYAMFGEHGALWLTDQIRTLYADGDTAAVHRHQQIASIYCQLAAPPTS